MDIGIVLGTKDRAEHLDRMLESLFKAIRDVSYEIIVIDGDSRDNTLEVLKKHNINKIFKESECMHPGNHEGIYPGCHSWGEIYNFGFKQTDAEWIMFGSDDIVFNEDCFTNAMKALRGQSDLIAGGMFYYRTFPSDPLFDVYGIDYTYGHILMLNYGLLRRTTFWEVGGLDETYVFYCADGDLSFKLREAGKVLFPLPECLVTHYKGMDWSSTFHMSQSNNDIAKYKDRWMKYVEKGGLEPRRLWLEEGMSHENPKRD